MKFTIIAAVSALSSLASGLALPQDQSTLVGAAIFPFVGATVRENLPNDPFTPAEVSRTNGMKEARTFFCFSLPASKTCTISFADATAATGSRTIQLFTTVEDKCPVAGVTTWNTRPSTDRHKGTFLVPPGGSGLAKVVEDFGLTFQTKSTPSTYGFEAKPVNDNDLVTWNLATGGFRVTCV